MSLRAVPMLAVCSGLVLSGVLAACTRTRGPVPGQALEPTSGQPPATRASLRGVCIHYDPTEWDCPDTNRFFQRAQDVDSVIITIYSAGGGQTVRVRRREADAIFLSRNAVELFLLRYYDAVDPAKAAALREALNRRSR